jgi:hypothetical protein
MPAVAQFEQARIGGGSDFLDAGEAVPFKNVVEAHTAGAVQQRSGEHIQRRPAGRNWMKAPAGDRPGGNQSPELSSQQALPHDMQRPRWPRAKHKHTS